MSSNNLSSLKQRHGTRFRVFEQTIDFHRVDELMFNRTRDDAPVIDETAERVATLATMPRATATAWEFDAYNALCKGTPKPTGLGDPMVQAMMQRVKQDDKYNELRAYTVGDDAASGLGACSLVEGIAEKIPGEVKAKADAARKAADEARAAQEALQALKDDPQAGQQETIEAQEAAEAAAHDAKAKRVALNAALRNNGKTIATAVQAAIAKAADEAETVNTAARCFSFGSGNAAATGGLTPQEKFRLAELVRNSGPAFKRLVTLLGRLSSEAIAKQASKTKHEAGAVSDVTLGSDVANVLEDELVLLMRPRLRRAMLAKLADDSAMMYEVENKEPKAKGPIVVLLDESDSMSGQREAEAKGIALALAHVCAKQRRRFVLHFFQSSVTHTVTIDPNDTSATESGVNVALRKLGEIASRGAGGGTDFNQPLLKAIETVNTDAMRDADVLMITDGISSVSPATLEAVNKCRDATGAKVYSMLIGVAEGTSQEVLKQFSDKVWSADSLLHAASELFELV